MLDQNNELGDQMQNIAPEILAILSMSDEDRKKIMCEIEVTLQEISGQYLALVGGQFLLSPKESLVFDQHMATIRHNLEADDLLGAKYNLGEFNNFLEYTRATHLEQKHFEQKIEQKQKELKKIELVVCSSVLMAVVCLSYTSIKFFDTSVSLFQGAIQEQPKISTVQSNAMVNDIISNLVWCGLIFVGGGVMIDKFMSRGQKIKDDTSALEIARR